MPESGVHPLHLGGWRLGGSKYRVVAPDEQMLGLLVPVFIGAASFVPAAIKEATSLSRVAHGRLC